MTIQLNAPGSRYVRSLISDGKVDKDSAWSFSAEDGNALLGDAGDDWTAYGRVHLAVDTDANEDTKARFKYPVAKGGKVYRAGVIAAKQRAGQQDAAGVEAEAGRLLELIDGKEANAVRPADLEARAAAEFRVAKDGRIEGYASVFNVPADLGYFIEQVGAGAFGDSIRDDDIRALFNHDPNFVLGRNRNGTLRLSEDTKGLAFDVTPPDTAFARDLLVSIERGDISQCSIGFVPLVQEWDERGDKIKRTIVKAQLWDVSPVTYPAFDTTSCAVRSLDAFRAERAFHTRASASLLARVRMRRAQLDRLIRA